MKSNFQKSSKFNKTFGNYAGDPQAPNWKVIEAQFALITEEYRELAVAIEERNEIELRDGGADLLETVYGLFHRLGRDADKDYHAVYESNMSKFCNTRLEAEQTEKIYEYMGVKTILVARGKRSALLVDGDQTDAYGKFHPSGKLLKSVNYRKPEFEK